MANYSNDKDLKEMFDKIDTNKNGFISNEEFKEALKSSENIKEADQHKIFQSLDLNKDGQISFAEFKYFYTFHQGQFKDMLSLFGITSKIRNMVKKVSEFDLDTSQNKFDFVLKDKQLASPSDLKTKIQVELGTPDKNPKIAELIKAPLEKKNCIALKFCVEDVAGMKEKLPGYLDQLKELLCELGPEAKEILEAIDLEVQEAQDGVLVVADLDKHPLFAAYIGMFKDSLQKLQDMKLDFSFIIGSNMDLSNLDNMTVKDLQESMFYLSLNKLALSIPDLLQINTLKKTLEKYMFEEKFLEISGILSLMSLSNINLEILLDSDKKKQMFKQLGVKEDANVSKDMIKTLKAIIESSGALAMLEAFSFLNDMMKDLHDAKMSSFSIIKKIDTLHSVLNIKANVYQTLKSLELFGEDDDDDEDDDQ